MCSIQVWSVSVGPEAALPFFSVCHDVPEYQFLGAALFLNWNFLYAAWKPNNRLMMTTIILIRLYNNNNNNSDDDYDGDGNFFFLEPRERTATERPLTSQSSAIISLAKQTTNHLQIHHHHPLNNHLCAQSNSPGPRTRRAKSKDKKTPKDPKTSIDEKRPRTAFTSEQLEKLRLEFQANS